MAYPEHEKLTEIKEKSQLLGEFLEWARGNGYEFCLQITTEKDTPWERVTYQPYHQSIERILGEFFSIDLNVLEEENRSMLAELKALS